MSAELWVVGVFGWVTPTPQLSLLLLNFNKYLDTLSCFFSARNSLILGFFFVPRVNTGLTGLTHLFKSGSVSTGILTFCGIFVWLVVISLGGIVSSFLWFVVW